MFSRLAIQVKVIVISWRCRKRVGADFQSLAGMRQFPGPLAQAGMRLRR